MLDCSSPHIHYFKLHGGSYLFKKVKYLTQIEGEGLFILQFINKFVLQVLLLTLHVVLVLELLAKVLFTPLM